LLDKLLKDISNPSVDDLFDGIHDGSKDGSSEGTLDGMLEDIIDGILEGSHSPLNNIWDRPSVPIIIRLGYWKGVPFHASSNMFTAG
jgi:hypothetical protein